MTPLLCLKSRPISFEWPCNKGIRNIEALRRPPRELAVTVPEVLAVTFSVKILQACNIAMCYPSSDV